MKRLNYLLTLCVALAALAPTPPLLGQQTGTLVVDMKNYTTEAKMAKGSRKSLEHAGIRWGMLDNTMLIPFVDEKFVNATLPNITRFGTQQTLELKPGQYTITCIGWEFKSTSRDPDKSLARSAYFNNDILAFTVEPGKTTTLEISPVYVSESSRHVLVDLTILAPNLKVQVLEDGKPVGDPVVINQRTPKSIAWNDYHGPLKFDHQD